MQFDINNKLMDLSLLSNGNDNFSLVSDSGKVYLKLKADAPGHLEYDLPSLFTESEEVVANKLDELYKVFLQDSYTGIESDEDEKITDPFNPEDISIETRVTPMETILRRIKQGTLILNPDFQRKEVWTDVRKSQLIESILLEIPIPMFYVSSEEDGKWTVVDGLQRISAFRDFVLGINFVNGRKAKEEGAGMRLTGLEFLKELEGKQMKDLPTKLYNRILEAEFSVTVINPGTPEEVKRNIFKRINTGGMPLSPQEIRNALYGGAVSVLLNDMSEEKIFKRATGNSVKDLRMEDKELLLRFLSFVIRPPHTYKKTQSIDTWLSDTMIIYNSFPSLKNRDLIRREREGMVLVSDVRVLSKDEIMDIFLIAMRRARKMFGDHAFRKSYGNMRRRPINKCLFETWGVLLGNMSDMDFTKLFVHRNQFMDDYSKLLDDEKFIIAISRDSMRPSSVALRYNTLENLIKIYTL